MIDWLIFILCAFNYHLSCLGVSVLSEAGDWTHDVDGETQAGVKDFMC